MSAKEVPNSYDETAQDEAVRGLARALEEARSAQRRFQLHTKIVGYHGEDFEQRWERVHRIVAIHNERAVQAARKKTIRAG